MAAIELESVTIHSTWRGVALGGVGGVLVTGAGAWAVSQAGFTPVPGTVLVIGCVLLGTVVFDLPLATRFTSDGCERRMLLRRQWISWERVDQLTRTRPSVMRVSRAVVHGGLVAKMGRRRYLLVDRCESRDEFHRLIEVVDVDGTPGETVAASHLPEPGESVPPTWLYRRATWRPDGGDRR